MFYKSFASLFETAPKVWTLSSSAQLCCIWKIPMIIMIRSSFSKLIFASIFRISQLDATGSVRISEIDMKTWWLISYSVQQLRNKVAVLVCIKDPMQLIEHYVVVTALLVLFFSLSKYDKLYLTHRFSIKSLSKSQISYLVRFHTILL